MFEAQYLASGDSVYGPWMERRGDNVIATLDLIANDSDLVITVEVYHKDREETGDGAAATGTAISASTIERHDTEYTGLKELVRLKIATAASDADPFPPLMRALEPVWFDSLAAVDV